jgi:serine/threonine-protein kinase
VVALGDYELEDEIGRGGMGHVFRARHVPTGAVRAIKLLAGVPDVEALTRFEREAQALARVAGRGVVGVHKAGVERGKLYFVMDLLPGGSLRDLVGREGVLPWRRAVALVAKLARVLERCAAVAIVHRDVKPGNVLLDEMGEPYLSDFGCVRDLAASTLTESGSLLGTIAYMSPEQLRGERATPASDVYALGVVLHELVTGKRPYAGPGVREFVAQAHAGKREDALPEGAPRQLDDLVAKALAPEPARRIPASDLARGLEVLLTAEDKPASPRRGLVPAAIVLGLASVAVGVLLAVATGKLAPRTVATPEPAPSLPASARPPSVPPRASPIEVATATRAIEGAMHELLAGSAGEAADAVASVASAVLAAPADERTKLRAAIQKRIDIELGPQPPPLTNPLRGFQSAMRIYDSLRLFDPAAEPGPALATAMESAALHSIGKVGNKERVEALLFVLARARQSRSAVELEGTRLEWARTLGGAVGDLSVPFRLLDDASRNLLQDWPSPLAHFQRGWLLMIPRSDHQPDPEKAREEYRAARAASDGTRFRAGLHLAHLEENAGHFKEAADLLREDWAFHDPGKTVDYVNYARVLVRSGSPSDLDAARKVLEQAAKEGDLVDKRPLLHDQAVALERGKDDPEALARVLHVLRTFD